MAASNLTDQRPQGLQSSRSFTRMEEANPTVSPRKRASTFQEAGIPAVMSVRRKTEPQELKSARADVFDNRDDDDDAAPVRPEPTLEHSPPRLLAELPAELKSLTERFLDSLNAKVHPTPLSAEQLSELFQDFYARAASHIATHVAELSCRIGREKSASPTATHKPHKASGKADPGGKRSDDLGPDGGAEMLTASEVAERRKARKLLEPTRVALEESVERVVCDRVYDRVWKHRSTDDDARDEKLRSKTAALALVGIGLKELHVETPSNEGVLKAAEDNEDQIHKSLAPAREALSKMDGERDPLGKLHHLKAAHQSIVETLSQLFPSSSSADEILPTLIYTLITSPPQGINVVSNLNFIQRFRAAAKVDGETAYCLVNLEAAISFLETVDLSSLREEELPEGPPKSTSSSGTPTPAIEFGEAASSRPGAAESETTLAAVPASDKNSNPADATATTLPGNTSSRTRPSARQRRISELVQAQAERIEAGRENFLSTADKVYDSINGTLENSFQFVFGRFRDPTSEHARLPRTLEDARLLVSSSSPPKSSGATGGSGGTTPPVGHPLGLTRSASDYTATTTVNSNNKVLDFIGGRRTLRDRSTDSTRSGGSGRRVAWASHDVPPVPTKDRPGDPTTATTTATTMTAATAATTASQAAGNLFATINPLQRLGVNVPGFARLGRGGAPGGGSTSPQPPSACPVSSPAMVGDKTSKLDDIVESPVGGTEAAAASLASMARGARDDDGDDDGMHAREALAGLRRLKPPRKRFLEVAGAGELRLAEVEDLLVEYRRLAKAIGEAVAV